MLQHYMQDKAPRGYVLLDRAKVEMEDGQLKLAGQTIIKLQTPDRTLVFRLDNKAKASEGADMFGDIAARCATGDEPLFSLWSKVLESASAPFSCLWCSALCIVALIRVRRAGTICGA